MRHVCESFGVISFTYVEFDPMSKPSDQAQISGQETFLRVPQATYASLMFYLKSLRREDFQKPLECPPQIDSRTWAQVHASLTTLGMLQYGQGTLLLRRLKTGETTFLGVLESQFGSDVIAAVECGESCAVGSLSDIHRRRSKSTVYRFESLVRMALKDQGRRPNRRRSGGSIHDSVSKADTNHSPSASTVELALLETEGQHLVRALATLLDENDLTSARQVREMLSDVHYRLKHLF